MAVFCTLFDSNYLDKGIALYESLEKVCPVFRLYVFAFDQRAYEVLCDLQLNYMTVIPLKDIETERLLTVRKERSPAEYCWTCTPVIIEYVLKQFNESECTYIDADLYFFSSPDILLLEIENTGDSIIITEHRYPPEIAEEYEQKSGKYCVQFNTFKNDENGRRVLDWWKERCLDWCHYTRDGSGKMGDQKYLECWTSEFNGVHELQNLGGGVAPWNVRQYTLTDDTEHLRFRKHSETFELVFYHFHNIRYLPFGLINIKSNTKDKRIRDRIYVPYLKHIERIRQMLRERYGLKFSMRKAYFINPVLRFIQNYILPFRIRQLSDVVSVRKLRKDHE